MSRYATVRDRTAREEALKKEKRRKQLKWKLLLLALALLVLSGYFYVQSLRHAQKVQAQLLSMEEARFVSVSDGDTIKVKMDGEVYTVRLIGIDCPESVHPDQEKNSAEGLAASTYTASLLKEGQRLYLQKDTSETDRYGRLLRYVWLDLPKDPTDETERRQFLLNARILLTGHGEASAYPPDTAMAEFFEKCQVKP